jgi:glucuronokinase
MLIMVRILKFLEKPKPEATSSRLASPVFYCLRRETLPLVTTYTQQNTDKRSRALGRFMVGPYYENQPKKISLT